MTNSPPRLIRLAGTHNVRDLGGYAAMDGSETRWRSILRGDGLHLLNENDMGVLIDEGLRTVIDLRGARELEIEPNPFASHSIIQYRNIPLFGALSPIDAVRGPNGASFDMAARYRDAIDQCRGPIAEVLTAIAEADDGVVLFHCSAGKDRTGIIAALLLSLVGVDDDTIIADYALTASIGVPLIERLRAQALARGTDPHLVESFLACRPETMRATLGHLNDNHGGTLSYLADIGLDEPTLRQLTSRLAPVDASTGKSGSLGELHKAEQFNG